MLEGREGEREQVHTREGRGKDQSWSVSERREGEAGDQGMERREEGQGGRAAGSIVCWSTQ